MKRIDRLTELVYDIYRELYKNATPKGDFDELVANALINDRGEKEIPFNDYEICSYKMEDIVDEMMKRKSCGMILKPHEKKSIRFQVYLGCSPKNKKA